MNTQFYVVYAPNTNTYLNDDTGEYGPFTQASKYRKVAVADMMASVFEGAVNGPHNEEGAE